MLLGVGTTMLESCLVIAIKSKYGTILYLQTHVLGVFPKKLVDAHTGRHGRKMFKVILFKISKDCQPPYVHPLGNGWTDCKVCAMQNDFTLKRTN